MAEEAIGKKQVRNTRRNWLSTARRSRRNIKHAWRIRVFASVPDLSAEEKKRIEEEIRVVGQQITREIKAKTGELQAELAVFAKGQQAAVDEQLDEYRRRLWREGRAWLRRRRNALAGIYQ